MSTLAAENAAWSGAIGEKWSQTFTRTSGTVTYSGTLLVEILTTDDPSVVVATSAGTSGLVAITTTGTNVAGAVFAWQIASASATAVNFPPGEYRIRMWATADGNLKRIVDHDWQVNP